MSFEKSHNFFCSLQWQELLYAGISVRSLYHANDLWGHVDCSSLSPDKAKEKKQHAKWVVKDAQVLSWILGSVEPNIILNLQPSKIAAEMWTYLKRLSSQTKYCSTISIRA